MAPIKTMQAAPASDFPSQNDGGEVQNLEVQNSVVYQQRIVDEELRQPIAKYVRLFGKRFSTGMKKQELMERIAVAMTKQKRKRKDPRVPPIVRRVQAALRNAIARSNSSEAIMSDIDIKACLRRGVYESLRLTHEATTSQGTSKSQTQMDTYLTDTTNTANVNQAAARQTTAVEETEVEVPLLAEISPELIVNEREKNMKLTFQPKSGRDVGIESGLLEILGTLGKERLEELDYDDFSRAVQIARTEKLATIKVEVQWNSS